MTYVWMTVFWKGNRVDWVKDEIVSKLTDKNTPSEQAEPRTG